MPPRVLRLPPDVGSPARARALVEHSLQQADFDRSLIDDAMLLVSELATNVVSHAHTPMQVRVDLGASSVRVEVEDDSSDMPDPHTACHDATSGRGLELVERLAHAWGAERREGGKIVWFELGHE